MPKRIQRKRTKGWRMPPNTVCVCRPGKWGNPFIPHDEQFTIMRLTPHECVHLFREAVRYLFDNDHDWKKRLITELRGKDLACWCSHDNWCHADVLLKLANQQQDE